MGIRLGLLEKECREMYIGFEVEWVKRGFEKFEELVWVWVEGYGSESANSLGVSTAELLKCDIV